MRRSATGALSAEKNTRFKAGNAVLATALVLVFWFLYLELTGFADFIPTPYQKAEQGDPCAVTVRGKNISLLTDYYALKDTLWFESSNEYIWFDDFVYFVEDKPITIENCFVAGLDPYNKYPDDCFAYNGINSASSEKELEAAFGDDCVRGKGYYAEIFIDGKEADYSQFTIPYDYLSKNDDSDISELWEKVKEQYPEVKSCAVLFCEGSKGETGQRCNNIWYFVFRQP